MSRTFIPVWKSSHETPPETVFDQFDEANKKDHDYENDADAQGSVSFVQSIFRSFSLSLRPFIYFVREVKVIKKKNSSNVCLRESAKNFWVFIASSTLHDKFVPKKFQMIYCCFNGLGIRFPWTSIIKVHTSIRNTFGSQILGDYQMLLDHQLHVRKLG